MPKMRVDERSIVVARPGVHIVYQPGERLAPDAHIVDVVRQGKGMRLTSRGDGRAKAPAAGASTPRTDAEQ
ncbi:hypothetical protein [Methylosinus sp. Sm6]|uniref:hypothetical protein n=1 Tax=Methylosinus sp. Sm6 TaxID=2866948 RepID=UPI001C99A15C|nr:hypothetical protein [Methylosinus sp. Sm6]MBY6242838.1 hypothetical protein [Methylosinus sp. Sm6]